MRQISTALDGLSVHEQRVLVEMRRGVWLRLWTAVRDGKIFQIFLWHAISNLNKIREYYYRKLLNQVYRSDSSPISIDIQGDIVGALDGRNLKTSLDASLSDTDPLPEFVRAMEGMSGQRYRAFINRLVRNTADARYLEVGSWAGSTAAAALYGNTVRALCIDNWSQFGGPKDQFFKNMERVISSDIDFRFIEEDFRKVEYHDIGSFNIYLFDGPHEENDQYDGIIIAVPALDDSFILIVDDWNWRKVRIGTFRALRDAGLTITASVEIRTTHNDTHGAVHGGASDWHNGYFMAALVGARSSDRAAAATRR